jgi:hypothetical protein
MKISLAGRMARGKAILSLLLLFCLAWPALRANAGKAGLTGHYELAGKNEDRSFSLDVTQTGSQAVVSFSAAMADGSDAAPDGDGKGEMTASGALAFTFKDSFDNEGTGTLVAEKDGYHLTLNATKVSDPRPLRFYGGVLLRKTSVNPQPG